MQRRFNKVTGSDAADPAACQALLRGGSRSFHAASLLLPKRVAKPATALYAFCRVADDAIDQASADCNALATLQDRLRRIYAGQPAPIPADRAFAHVAASYQIPIELPDALLEGFAWDAAGRRYDTLADVEAYAAHVAGAVGVMMALIMGVRDPESLDLANELGIAMQLTNIARDVGEDAAAGRLYLPLAWLREAGIDPESWLSRPAFDDALGGVVQRLLAAASEHYRRADEGIARLPADCRPGIRAARLLYAAIGDEVARRGFDSVSRRAVVPARRKLPLLARALWARGPAVPPSRPAWWDLEARFIRVIELFQQLEEREQLRRSRPVTGDPT